MKVKTDKEYMLIGEVARKLGIHEQTIRMYERKGLIKPHRTTKNTRYFTKEDVAGIILVVTLTQELGLNIAGVRMLLHLAERYSLSNEDLMDLIESQQDSYGSGVI